MATLKDCIASLETHATREAAWVRFEPVDHPADSHYQLRGNRDGLVLLASAALEAVAGESHRAHTGDLFPSVSPDDQFVLRIVCDPAARHAAVDPATSTGALAGRVIGGVLGIIGLLSIVGLVTVVRWLF